MAVFESAASHGDGAKAREIGLFKSRAMVAEI